MVLSHPYALARSRPRPPSSARGGGEPFEFRMLWRARRPDLHEHRVCSTLEPRERTEETGQVLAGVLRSNVEVARPVRGDSILGEDRLRLGLRAGTVGVQIDPHGNHVDRVLADTAADEFLSREVRYRHAPRRPHEA